MCGMPTTGDELCNLHYEEQEAEADARLIAAAPELLRELKSAIFYIETYGGEVTTNFSAGGNMDAVKAIIAIEKGA